MFPSESQAAGDLRGWLRGLKDQSGASFADIARGIGEEERTVKRWMAADGKVTVPPGDKMIRLLDYFGVKLTPPAPRSVALSLLGEIRDVQETVHRLESGPSGETRSSLPEIEGRLERLVDEVAEAVELLSLLVKRRGPSAVERKQAKG